MSTPLETYLTLRETTKKYKIPAGILTQLIDSGRIRAIRANNGDVLVAEGDARMLSKREELWKRVKHLDGTPIGMSQACKRYNLNFASLSRWVTREYIRVIEDRRGGGRGNKRLLNEADVAYTALVLEEQKAVHRPGRRVFTQEYIPPHLWGTLAT